VLESLREQVLEANLELVRRGLVLYTFGNASGIDRGRGLVVIKPSGVPYEKMKASDLVVTDLEGRVIEGKLRPSSDLDTHLVLYRTYLSVGGVVHTHSEAATAWAQSGKEIPCFGTTHADYFNGPVPVTHPLDPAEIETDYEENTGVAIVRRFTGGGLNPADVPGVLVAGHGPFAWGEDVSEAAHNAVILEGLAKMAFMTLTINPAAAPIPDALREQHFFRKHGAAATYGQGEC
jgi:L-ribulose-5-phosphate 4-epimerase